MKKVFFYGAISLDGFLSSKDDNLKWLFDTELNPNYSIADFEDHVDTVVMGNTTYRETQKLLGADPMFPGKEKIIFSRNQTGPVVGGGSIMTQLVKNDLIDEFWIQIVPVIIGTGKRLFEENTYEKRFKLVGTKRIGELAEIHLKRLW
ncbi:dihydrofolate reductase [Oenococcus sp. UCMA 14587]|nr:dihydrofolate reductase [Oenococcus sp. UCMA 14587]